MILVTTHSIGLYEELDIYMYPGSAELGYTMPLQTV